MVRLKLDILKGGSDIRNSTEGSIRIAGGDRNVSNPAKLMESGDQRANLRAIHGN